MHILFGLLCIFIGAFMTWAGYRIQKPYQRPPGVTGFASPIVSRSLLIGSLGDLLIICGLILAIIFSIMFFLN
ncbi:MAG TPA: hypothetical protein VNV88_10335 [Candidatus Solibacter sp.]|nr:hypothetical protein [Candidatus Solibacter sp.]